MANLRHTVCNWAAGCDAGTTFTTKDISPSCPISELQTFSSQNPAAPVLTLSLRSSYLHQCWVTFCLSQCGMIYSTLLTGELQEGFPAQDSSDAVLSSALVLPEIRGLAGIYYYQVPMNQVVTWLRLNDNICSVDQPAVNAEVWIKENSTTQYWKPIFMFYLKQCLFHFTDAKHFPTARNWTAW